MFFPLEAPSISFLININRENNMSLSLNLSPSPSPSPGPHPSSKALLDARPLSPASVAESDVDVGGGEISTLMKYIDDRLKGVPIYESSCRIWLRRSAVATGFTLIAYGIPSVALMMLQNLATVLGKKTAFNSDVDFVALSTIAVTGDVLCTIAFDTGATLGLVEQTTRALSREEEILLEYELSLCQKVAAYTAAVAGALFAKFPEAWGAYNAVDSKLPPSVGFSMQQMQIAGPAFSILLTFSWLPQVCRFSYKDFEWVLENAKKHFAEELKCRKNGLRVNSPERQNLLNILRDQIALEEDRREAIAILQALFDAPAINNTGVQVSRSCSYVLDFLAACLTGFLLINIVESTHEGVDALVGNEAAVNVMAVVVALFTAKLWGSLVRRGLELPYEGLHPASHPPITKELRPKLYKTCTAVGMVCALTPIIPQFAGSSALFGSAGLPLAIMGSIAAFFLSLATVHQFRDSLIKKLSQDELLMMADREIEEIYEVVIRTKISEFARFLKDLTLAQRQGWVGAAISDAQINDYLNA